MKIFKTVGGVVLAMAVGASGAEAAAYQRTLKSAEAAERRHSERQQRRVSVHGDESPILSLPVFDALSSEAGRAAGVFHLESDNTTRSPLKITYAWRLTDGSSGKLLAEGMGPKVGKIDPASFYAGESWQIPPLSTGFYRVQFTVASSGNDASANSVEIVDWWLEAKAGFIQELSPEEWQVRAPGARSARAVKL